MPTAPIMGQICQIGLVVVLFALGLMAKPMLVTLPVLLLLLDYWPLGRVRLPSPLAPLPEARTRGLFQT